MNDVLLLILLSMLLFFECITLKFDVISPPIVLIVGYIVSTLFLVFNRTTWNIELSLTTVILIFSANLITYLFCLLFRPVNKVRKSKEPIGLFYISSSKTAIILVFDIIISILFWYEIRRIALLNGATNDISSIMSRYRQVMLFSDMSAVSASFNPIIMQLFKFTLGLAYVSLYFLCMNLVKGDKLKNNKNYILIIIAYLLSSMLQSSRSQYLQFILAFIVIYVITSGVIDIRVFISKYKKIVKAIILCMIIFIAAFFLMRNLLGRNVYTDFFEYISAYISGSLYCFNGFIEQYTGNGEFTNETFSAINRFLYKLSLVDAASSTSMEFVYILPTVKTNVYTALRRWINDFGFVGMYILQSIFGMFFAIFYKYCREHHDSKVIVLAYMYIAVLTHFFDDMLFKNFVSMSFILQVVVMYFSYLYIKRIRIKVGNIVI